jgi:hypothetical protein
MKAPPNKIIKALNLLREALYAVQEAQAAWDISPLEFTSQSELNHIASDLNRMIEALETGRRIETPGLWRVVTDTWPFTNQLAVKIVEAELAYQKLA